jgi:hypothetical protein
MFETMYREQYFMRGREMGQYARRQAASAIQLQRELAAWMEQPRVRTYARVVARFLIKVHQRQQKDLRWTRVEEPQWSFYWDRMIRWAEEEGVPRLAIHAVAYERGRRRYAEIVGQLVATTCDTPTLWVHFLYDAESNRDLCVAALEESLGKEAADFIRRVSEYEAQLMKMIDDKNAKRAISPAAEELWAGGN